ncbi:MAG: PH domain-containing protein, partial [Candidatus Anstonellales archaeon]
MSSENANKKKEDERIEFFTEHNLDKNVIFVWHFPYFVISVVFLLLISLLIYFNIIPFPSLSLDNPSTIAILLVLIANLFLIFYLKLKYTLFTYSIDSHGIVIRFGVISRKRIVIPYEKVQNINTKRDIVERLFGTCTLTIETAAGKDIGEGIIPGVSVKDREKIIQTITNAIEMYHNNKKAQEIDVELIKKDHQAILSTEEKIVQLTKRLEELEKNIKSITQKEEIVKEDSKGALEILSFENKEVKTIEEKEENVLKKFLLAEEKKPIATSLNEIKQKFDNVEIKQSENNYENANVIPFFV